MSSSWEKKSLNRSIQHERLFVSFFPNAEFRTFPKYFQSQQPQLPRRCRLTSAKQGKSFDSESPFVFSVWIPV